MAIPGFRATIETGSRGVRRRNIAGVLLGTLTALSLVSGPAFAGGGIKSTYDVSVDGSGHCHNSGGNSGNCNIYDGKQYVWVYSGAVNFSDSDSDMSGKNATDTDNDADNTYFFAITNTPTPGSAVDGSANNLSCGNATCPGGTYTQREFYVDQNGQIIGVAPSDTHQYDATNQLIRAYPYNNETTNSGGEYELAVCLAADYPNLSQSDCSFDNFKVQPTIAEFRYVAGLSVRQRARTVTFTWIARSTVGVAGYNLYAGKSVLNRSVIPAHGAGLYRYTAHHAGTAKFSLHVVLTDGQSQVVNAG